MMFITVGDSEYELSTKLGIGKKIEEKFKLPIGRTFENLGNALTDELLTIISIAADKTTDAAFRAAIYDNWDYSELYGAVQELVAKLMYSGTPEQNEAKIAKAAMSEPQKNALRELLGIPIPTAPPETAEALTGNE